MENIVTVLRYVLFIIMVSRFWDFDKISEFLGHNNEKKYPNSVRLCVHSLDEIRCFNFIKYILHCQRRLIEIIYCSNLTLVTVCHYYSMTFGILLKKLRSMIYSIWMNDRTGRKLIFKIITIFYTRLILHDTAL